MRHPTTIRAPEDNPTTPSGNIDFVDFCIRCFEVNRLGRGGAFFVRTMVSCSFPLRHMRGHAPASERVVTTCWRPGIDY